MGTTNVMRNRKTPMDIRVLGNASINQETYTLKNSGSYKEARKTPLDIRVLDNASKIQ